MVIAYLRVSTGKQHLENQQDEVSRYALSKNITVDKWVTETISGKTDRDSRKLGSLVRSLEQGDTLIVTEVSRLSRTLHEVMSIMGICLNKKVTVYSIKDGYAFDDSINSKVLSFAFGLVAEIERNLISQRTKEALALRRSQGVRLGREKGDCPKVKFLFNSKKELIKWIERGSTLSKICKHFNVSMETLRAYRRTDKQVDNMIIERFGEKRYKALLARSEAMNQQKKDRLEN